MKNSKTRTLVEGAVMLSLAIALSFITPFQRLLPFGGYVAMEGEDESSDDENAFYKKPVWQRIIITAAIRQPNFK